MITQAATKPIHLFYTINEAATALSVSEKTVRRLLKRGLLTRSKAIRKILIPIDDVVNFATATR